MLLLISVEVTAIAGGVANIDDRVFPSFSGSPIGSGGSSNNFPRGNNFPRDDSDSNNNLSGVGFPGIIDSRNFPLGTGSFSNGHGFSRGGSDNFFSSGGDNFPRNGGGNFFDGGIGNGFSRGGGVFGGGLPGQ
ncbi:hypothetical protein VNO78_30863 [Psophocarpus tetragonolobus]|uniref:Glycine-rich protein n=1 Tax=Psophocarpus tetragonolobus TaxID=3891 RepID=A0AAN9RY46_PSOTE